MVEHLILALVTIVAVICAVMLFRHRDERLKQVRDDLSFRSLAQNAPVAIWWTDQQGQCVYANEAWQSMTGMREGQWCGHGWTEALHPEDRDRVSASLLAAVASAEQFEKDLRWQRGDGSVFWTKCLSVPEFDSGGQAVGCVGIHINIQGHRDLADKLSAALKKVELADASMASFLASMSHEIRTPVSGVIGLTELLLDTDLAEDQRKHVQMIGDAGRAMMQLFNDGLAVAKFEAGDMPLNLEPTDLREKLCHTAKLLEPLARSKKLSFGVWVDDAVPAQVQLDALRLRQIILNLVGNSVRFTDTGGIDVEARVEISSTGRHLLISVIDTGAGIEQSRLEAILAPRSQERAAIARRTCGAGHGLSIVNHLVAMMGGIITVHSRLGVGTNFTVRLPLIEVVPGTSPLSIEGEAPVPALTHLEGIRLLIAEDHAINQQLIAAMVATLGINAQLVENGQEAIDAVVQAAQRGRPFDAILMDVQMPEVDGLEACRALRKLGFDADRLPIIALIANCYPDDIAACRKAGMQSHLGKPVTTIALARELARCFPPPPMASREAIASQLERRIANNTKPSLADLEVRYLDRKGQLFDILRESLSDTPETIDWDKLARELHKLAGVAANFGEAELGKASSRLERRLRMTPEPHLRLAALQREWPSFEEAASIKGNSAAP